VSSTGGVVGSRTLRQAARRILKNNLLILIDRETRLNIGGRWSEINGGDI
jgi:hypothetical protein